MKRLLGLLFAVLFIFSISVEAFAELPDFTSLTDEELHALVDGARNELKARELVINEKTVLLNQEGVQIYLTGPYEVEAQSYSNYTTISFEAVVVNDTDKKINVSFESSSVNGWDVDNSGILEISAGKKKKGNLKLRISDADITTYEEIEDIELVFKVWDDDTWNTMFTSDNVIVYFK